MHGIVVPHRQKKDILNSDFPAPETVTLVGDGVIVDAEVIS